MTKDRPGHVPAVEWHVVDRPSSGAPDIVGAYGITGDIPLPLPAAIRRAFFS